MSQVYCYSGANVSTGYRLDILIYLYRDSRLVSSPVLGTAVSVEMY